MSISLVGLKKQLTALEIATQCLILRQNVFPKAVFPSLLVNATQQVIS